MALRIHYKKRSQGITWKTGHIYNFRYSNYENDPSPTYIHISSFSGYHPNTGREWRFHQGLNLSYIPRKDRKEFIKIWKENMQKNRNMRFTWELVKKRFPYLKHSIRRYFYSPSYYIRNPREIPIEEWENEVIRGWAKDFSMNVKRKIASKLKRLFTGKRRK